ncbi:MAG: GIN domain-containing protein [Muribaculaceae bacterium]
MKTLKSISVLAIAAVSLFASSTVSAAEVVNNEKVNAICFSDGVNISVSKGESTQVQCVDAEVNYMIEDGVLTIKCAAHNAHINVVVPELKSIQYYGSENASVSGVLNVDNLLISTSSEGNLSVNGVQARNLVCGVLGSGNIVLNEVNAGKLTFGISGSGKVIMGSKSSDEYMHNTSHHAVHQGRYSIGANGEVTAAVLTIGNVRTMYASR